MSTDISATAHPAISPSPSPSPSPSFQQLQPHPHPHPPHAPHLTNMERRSTTGGYKFPSFNHLLSRRSSGADALVRETVEEEEGRGLINVPPGGVSPRGVVGSGETTTNPEPSSGHAFTTGSAVRENHSPDQVAQHHPLNPAPKPPLQHPPRANTKPMSTTPTNFFSLPSISFPSASLFRASAAVGHVHVPMGELEGGHLHTRDREREKEATQQQQGRERGKHPFQSGRRETSFMGLSHRRSSGEILRASVPIESPPESDTPSSSSRPGKSTSQPTRSPWATTRRSLSTGRGLRRSRKGQAIDLDTVVVGGTTEAEEVAVTEMTRKLALATEPNVGVGPARDGDVVEGRGDGGEGDPSLQVELSGSAQRGDGEEIVDEPIGYDFPPSAGEGSAEVHQETAKQGESAPAVSPLSGSPIIPPVDPPEHADHLHPEHKRATAPPSLVTPHPAGRTVSSTASGPSSQTDSRSSSSTLIPLSTPPSSIGGARTSSEALLSLTPSIPLWKQQRDAVPPVELSEKRAATLRAMDELFSSGPGKAKPGAGEIDAAVRRIFTEDAIIEDPVVYCKRNEELALHIKSLVSAFSSVKLLSRKPLRISKPREDGDESGQCRFDQRVEYDIKGACVKKVIHSLLVVDFAPDGRIQHLRDCWNFQSLPVSHGTFSLRRSSAKMGLLGLMTRRRRVFWNWESK